jgi:hypothetical protein
MRAKVIVNIRPIPDKPSLTVENDRGSTLISENVSLSLGVNLLHDLLLNLFPCKSTEDTQPLF